MITHQEHALRNLKTALGNVPWKIVASELGIKERVVLSYIAAPNTKSYREMPDEVWEKIEKLSGHSLSRTAESLYYPQRKVISVSSQKGGVGKTTLASILASIYAHMGYRTLIIDMDPQANLTEQFFDEEHVFPAEILKDVHQDEFDPGEAHVWHMFEADSHVKPMRLSDNLYLVGSSLDLSETQQDKNLTQVVNNFHDNLEKLKNDFDIVILDTLPSFGNILAAAHRSADWLIVPTELARFAKKGISYQLKTAMNTKSLFNTDLNLLGIVINKVQYTKRSEGKLLAIQDAYLGVLKDLYGNHILSPLLKTAPHIVESQAMGEPLIKWAPKADITLQLTELSHELLRRIKEIEENV